MKSLLALLVTLGALGADIPSEDLANTLIGLTDGYQASIANLEYSAIVRFDRILTDSPKSYIAADEERYHYRILGNMSYCDKKLFYRGRHLRQYDRTTAFNGERYLRYNPARESASIEGHDSYEVLGKSALHNALMIPPTTYHEDAFPNEWMINLKSLIERASERNILKVSIADRPEYSSLVYRIDVPDSYVLYVDVEHGGIVRKLIRYDINGDKPYISQEVDSGDLYEVDGVFFPTSVSVVHYKKPSSQNSDSPEIRLKVEAEILKEELRLGELTESDFEFSLPNGTVVHDTRSGLELVVSDGSFETRANLLDDMLSECAKLGTDNSAERPQEDGIKSGALRRSMLRSLQSIWQCF